jgi:hypothetical protein
MKVEVKTKTGSVYILDQSAMSWERVVKSKQSGRIRTDGGQLTEWPIITLGEGVEMYGPPINPAATGRLVYTSDVQSWKEIE